MIQLPPDTVTFLTYSPYFAAIENRTEAEIKAFDLRYEHLPEPVRQFLLAPETADAIAGMERQGVFPAPFRVAISRLVALVALGDVQLPQIPALLTKIGMTEPQIGKTSASLGELLKPALSARAAAEAPILKPLQPLVTHAPSVDSAPAAPRGILDLRKPAP